MTVKALFAMKTPVRSATVLTAALVAWALWYLGIGWFNGGEGLEWLHGFQWGALPASAAIAVGCAAAVVRDYRLCHLSAFLVLATALCFVGFAAAREELYWLHSRRLFAPAGFAPSVRLALYWAGVSLGLAWLASRFLARMRWWTALLLAAALALAQPLAALTVTGFPGARHGDICNAIRLGYPVLWAAILLPAALRLGRERAT
jgi:hypothetical protein